jgi:hypothetical protein
MGVTAPSLILVGLTWSTGVNAYSRRLVRGPWGLLILVSRRRELAYPRYLMAIGLRPTGVSHIPTGISYSRRFIGYSRRFLADGN